MIETVFGNNLKRLRGINKMTRQAFADAMNLPVTTVAGYEIGGREAKYKTLIKLADFFGVSIDDLIRGDEEATVLNSVRMAAEKHERRLATLNKLADFFEDTIDDLVGGKVKIEFKDAEDNQ